jgi:hypothetical protein
MEDLQIQLGIRKALNMDYRIVHETGVKNPN